MRAQVVRSGPRSISGSVYDLQDPLTRFTVELLIDGVPIALARAETFVETLAEAGIGDGSYGFDFVLSSELLFGAKQAQVFLANHSEALAPPLDLEMGTTETIRNRGSGEVAWHGGLLLTGWIERPADALADCVRALVDDEVVEVAADRWHHIGETGGGRPVPAFALYLPAHLADGRVRRVRVTNGAGVPLRGSPVTILAFPDLLTTAVTSVYGPEAGLPLKRARLFDRLSPRTVPFTDWNAWEMRHQPPAPVRDPIRLVVLLIGDAPDDVASSLASLEEQTGLEWVAAALPSPDRISFSSGDCLAFLDSEGAGYGGVLAIPAGSILLPGAGIRLGAAIDPARESHFVYGDVAIGPRGQEVPLPLPAFDYERWLEQGYGSWALGLPLTLAARAARQGAGSLYHLACAAMDSGPAADVVHVPGIVTRLVPPDRGSATRHLAEATRDHLQRRNCHARIRPGSGACLPAVHVGRPCPSGLVSIVVPTRDRVDLLQPCLASLRPTLETVETELIVVDNDSSSPDTRSLLAMLEAAGHRVLPVPGPFNYAHLCNRAVAAARGQFILLLNNDIEAKEEGWLQELLGRMAEPTVDAVGAVLRWPSGVVQHAGIVLGPGFSASHTFDDRLADDPGFGDLLRVAHAPSAATAACLLVRRTAYEAVGGMDALRFPVNFNDVDLCLKIGARGGRVVLTPHLNLVHHASASRGRDTQRDQVKRYRRELRALRARWGEVLANDPAYSPLLALTDTPYEGLACPPRNLAPRRRIVPAPADVPSSW